MPRLLTCYAAAFLMRHASRLRYAITLLQRAKMRQRMPLWRMAPLYDIRRY